MKYSESTDKLFAAFSAFQGEVKNPGASADNPFFKSRYTPLDDILDLARPILAKHGLSVAQEPCSTDGAVGVATVITHQSGQYMQSEPYYLKLAKDDPQGGGSAITYARRYSLAAMLGIATDPDDDGNAASGNKGKPAEKPKGKGEFNAKQGTVICPKCGKAAKPHPMQDGRIAPPEEVLERLGCCMECHKTREE